MITTTVLNWKQPNHFGQLYNHWKHFTQYTAENGNSIYTIGNRLVTKEEGNKEFIDIVSKYEHETTRSSSDKNDDDIIEGLRSSIDPWTMMIDDYTQMKEAEAHNDAIYAILSAFREAAGK